MEILRFTFFLLTRNLLEEEQEEEIIDDGGVADEAGEGKGQGDAEDDGQAWQEARRSLQERMAQASREPQAVIDQPVMGISCTHHASNY